MLQKRGARNVGARLALALSIHALALCPLALSTLALHTSALHTLALTLSTFTLHSRILTLYTNARIPYLVVFPDDLYQRLFTLIADHEIDAWQRCNGLWVQFRVTAGHDQQSRRVTASGLADQLARTAVAQV